MKNLLKCRLHIEVIVVLKYCRWLQNSKSGSEIHEENEKRPNFVAESLDQGKWHQPGHYAEPLLFSQSSQGMNDDEMRRQKTSMKAFFVRGEDVYPITEFDPAPNAVSNLREPENVPIQNSDDEEMDYEVSASSPLTVPVSSSPHSSNYVPFVETFPNSDLPPSPMSRATSSGKTPASDVLSNSTFVGSLRTPVTPKKFRRNSIISFMYFYKSF